MDDCEDKEIPQGKKTSTTSLVRRFLSNIWTSFSHGSRTEATLLQSSPLVERRGSYNNETTSQEETTTSTSNLGLQCSYNIGASQHHYHYHYDKRTSYERCTSYDLEDDVRNEEDTVRRHQGWRAQHAQSTSTSTTNTYSLRWCNTYISRGGLVNFELTSTSVSVSTSTSWTTPAAPNNLSQQTSWSSRQLLVDNNMRRHSVCVKPAKTFRTSLLYLQELNIEERQPSSTSTRSRNDLNDQQRLYDNTTAGRCARELLGNLIVHSTKPNSEPSNLLRRLQRTNIAWEMYRQLLHQIAAACRSSCTAVQLVTKHCAFATEMDRDITTTVSKMDMRRLSIRDDTSCHRRYPQGEYSDKQPPWPGTTTSTTSGSTTSYLA